MQDQISSKSIGIRFGLLGIRLYKKHHTSPSWKEKYFVLKLFASRFYAFFGVFLFIIFLNINPNAMLWCLPFLLGTGLLYGFWAESFFRKQRDKA